ncbi:MAG: hypothetical protein KUG56_02530 [Kordiimonadaceae bacterium]|nr:hypothetical protein [Kordiimonadaceae bacterium]
MKVTIEERMDVESFLFKEARYADESRYSDWESLVDDDMHYWVPLAGDQAEGELQVSILNDNRPRLATRIRQLNTGVRHAQLPVSRMRRTVSNIEIEKMEDGSFHVLTNTVLYEERTQTAAGLSVTWPARVEYKLRHKDGELKMFLKKVMLLNSEGPLRGIGFIL